MELIKTDLGLLREDNIAYLMEQQILDESCKIRFGLTQGMDGEVQMYSLYRWAYDAIAYRMSGKPSLDEVITTMRIGRGDVRRLHNLAGYGLSVCESRSISKGRKGKGNYKFA